MHSQYFEDLLKFAIKARPIMASVTVFAYVNAFVLPITTASANPGQDRDEQDIRKTSQRAPQSTEQEQVAFKVTPISQKQIDFINKVNILFGYVGEVQSTQALKERELVNWKPRLNREPSEKQKQLFIRHVISHALNESQLDVADLKEALKGEKVNKNTLRFVQYLRKELRAKLGETFDSNQQTEVRKALRYLKEVTTKEQEATHDEIFYLKDNLIEAKEVHSYIQEAHDALKGEVPLWKAMNELSKVLSKAGGNIPDRVQKAIARHSLTNVSKEYANTENGFTAFLAGIVHRVTSPSVGKAVVVFGVLNAPAVAAAFGFAPLRQQAMSKFQIEEAEDEEGELHSFGKRAMTLINAVPPTQTFTENQPLLIQNSTQVVGAANNMVTVTIDINPSIGNVVSLATTPDVTPVYTPASPPIGPSNNIVTLSGNATQVNIHLANLQFNPTNNYCATTQFGGTAGDGVTFKGMLFQFLCNRVYQPITISSCAIPPLTNGGSVVLNAAACPITDVNGATPDKVLTQVTAVTGGWYNKISNPAQPISNFTLQDTQSNLVQFTSDNSNNAPTSTTIVCDLNADGTINQPTCSAPIANKFSFTPTSSDPNYNLAGLVSGVILGVISLAASVFVIVCLAKRKSASNKLHNPEAQMLAREGKYKIQWSEDQEFTPFVSKIASKLQNYINNYNDLTEDEKRDLFKDVAQAIDNPVNGLTVQGKGLKKIILFSNVQGEEQRMNACIDNIAKDAAARYHARRGLVPASYPPVYQPSGAGDISLGQFQKPNPYAQGDAVIK